MNNIKKITIAFLVALVLVVIIEIVWSKFGTKQTSIYVAVKEIYKGEKILETDIKKISLNNVSDISKYINNDIVGKIAKNNISSDKIISSEDVTQKELELEDNESYEYITIEVKSISDSLAYQIKKGDYINVYYTTKNKKLENLFIGKEEVIQNDLSITYRIFENTKVIGLYNSVGQEVKDGNQYNGIMLRVKREDAMFVSNIKDEGVFTTSILK